MPVVSAWLRAELRRGWCIAVVWAIGMTRIQSRGVVATQATLLALVGVALGLPLGVALGRTMWRYVADTTPPLYVASVALLALVLAAPAALLAANLLAVWPGRLVAGLRIRHTLRAE